MRGVSFIEAIEMKYEFVFTLIIENIIENANEYTGRVGFLRTL